MSPFYKLGSYIKYNVLTLVATTTSTGQTGQAAWLKVKKENIGELFVQV